MTIKKDNQNEERCSCCEDKWDQLACLCQCHIDNSEEKYPHECDKKEDV